MSFVRILHPIVKKTPFGTQGAMSPQAQRVQNQGRTCTRLNRAPNHRQPARYNHRGQHRQSEAKLQCRTHSCVDSTSTLHLRNFFEVWRSFANFAAWNRKRQWTISLRPIEKVIPNAVWLQDASSALCFRHFRHTPLRPACWPQQAGCRFIC